VITVCHRCGRDLSFAACRICQAEKPSQDLSGVCKHYSLCTRCNGHYCPPCLADHSREVWCGDRTPTQLTFSRQVA